MLRSRVIWRFVTWKPLEPDRRNWRVRKHRMPTGECCYYINECDYECVDRSLMKAVCGLKTMK